MFGKHFIVCLRISFVTYSTLACLAVFFFKKMSSNVFYFFRGMSSNVNYVVLYFWVLAVFYYQKILIYCV